MNIIIGLLCLCFLIFFHELGHFIFAKIFKVKVEAFSIGFGPRLLHKKIGDTDYRISLIPLGGYCGIKGEKDFQKALEQKLTVVSGEKDSMYGINPLKRALIGFAGPLFNFLFSVIAFTIISSIGYSTYSFSNKIIVPEESIDGIQIESPARDAGLLSGDIITHINDSKINNFSDLQKIVNSSPDEDLLFTVERNNEILQFTVHTLFDKTHGIGRIGCSADENSFHEEKISSKNIIFAFGEGFAKSFEMIKLTFKGIAILFKGADFKNSVSGPARIADMLGETVSESASDGIKTLFINLLNFLALISISLFVMNLLPIPILDGGLIVFSLIEAITRKKIHPKVYYYIQAVGLSLIVILFLIGLSGDIMYFINK